MRRADRLFQIVELLRRKRLLTAQEIANQLEVSVRTIYRDMDDLLASGLPLKAEAGVGYALDRGYDLPPLMFNRAELEALEVAGRLLAAWADPELKAGVESALSKIQDVLPHTLKRRPDVLVYAPDFFVNEALWAPMPAIRQALRESRKLWLSYQKENGEASERVLRPLAIHYWGRAWTVVGWCELRGGFRHFRLDRCRDWRVLDEAFSAEPGKTYDDFLRQLEAECA